MVEDLQSWGNCVGEESRKSFKEKVDSGFFQKYMSGKVILDIGYRGYLPDVKPILPHAIGVDTDFPGYDGKRLPFADQSVDAVHSSHCLEHILDPIAAIREWHRVLKAGGFLIIAVPHRDLYEKRSYLPSIWNADHKRLYTPSSLLNEIESALAPNSFRIRELRDNDSHYDYSISPANHAGGSYEIEVVVERIQPPKWTLEARPIAIDEKTPPVTSIQTFREQWNAPSSIKTICALKLDHIGDFVMTIPAFRELQQKFPEASIDLICGSWNAEIARSLGIFRTVYEYDFMARNPSLATASASSNLNSEVMNRVYDLAIDMRVPTDTRGELKKIRAQWYAGIGIAGLDQKSSIVLPAYPDGRSCETVLFVPPKALRPPPSEATNRYTRYHRHKNLFVTGRVQLERGTFRVHFLCQFRRKLISRRPVIVISAFNEGQLLKDTRLRFPFNFDLPVFMDITAEQVWYSFGFRVRRGSFHWIAPAGIVIEPLQEPARSVHVAEQASLLVTLVSSRLIQPSYGSFGQQMLDHSATGD